ncbi:cell division protein FtsZ [Patiriisocius marinistellae]|uniref:Cell division protein FtsZ n=1 Tax=Patiriisocius marinistellae TaxID=2494560 RepID=A0A5J4FZT8_9FLAO|nr:cell division protein FtsZ [Patiriisocius marinistellae]GEQ86968.1 cell division protein FtsZ [Patiriisocius marinistellae]
MSSNTEFENIAFDLPKNQSNVIKVIGVGGGGSNAINHMFNQGIKGVDFVICNTDAQALENSSVPNKIQLGVDLTEGLGAGANPKVGEQSAVESMADIKNMLTTNTKMIFITAGMGGGTGTGAAPIIARMAKDLDILTVGIVTIPFQFEGKLRNEQALVGVENLRANVDSLVVINNNKLREVYGNLGFKAGFSKADEVLATAARGIAEVITHHYTQNIDLRDAKTVLSNSGTAIMGSATASGANRAHDAISKALDSPLLNDNKIAGAKNVLLLIVSGAEEITIDEIGEISDHIQNEAGHSANIIMGVGDDDALEGAISITVIATGFDAEQQNEISNTETKKIIHTLEEEQKAEQDLTTNVTASPVELPKAEVPPAPVVPEPAKVIRHTLFEEEEIQTIKLTPKAVVEAPVQNKIPFEGYVATSNFIKNIDVESTAVDIHVLAEFEQLIINEIDVNDFEIVKPKEAEETKTQEAIISSEIEQPTTVDFTINTVKKEVFNEAEISEEKEEESAVGNSMLMFDMPINDVEEETAEVIKHDLQVEDIQVNDHVEVIPVNEQTKDGIRRYSLDDYQEKEEELLSAKPTQKVAEETIVFETKTVPQTEIEADTEYEVAEIDPMNAPISQLLKDRTEERKRKLKDFNYKFRNSGSKLEDIEKQPAYKRAGIELEDAKNSGSSISRTSVNTDDDNIDLRTNNSFLHDNVD